MIVGEEDADDLKTNETLRNKVLELVNTVATNKFTESSLIHSIDLGKDIGGPNKRFWTLDPISNHPFNPSQITITKMEQKGFYVVDSMQFV